MRLLGLILVLVSGGCLTEANQPPILNANSAAETPTITGDREAGLVSYEELCSRCHLSIADSYEDSQKAGATFDRISGAADVPAHAGIDPWLSDEDSENITAALNAPVEESSGEGDIENGIALYADYGCNECHNEIDDSAKKGRDAAAIEASADIGPHSGVNPFPEGQDLLDLAAALAE